MKAICWRWPLQPSAAMAANHPFAGGIRSGYVQVEIVPEELGFSVNIGELLLTECEMVNGFVDSEDEPPHHPRLRPDVWHERA